MAFTEEQTRDIHRQTFAFLEIVREDHVFTITLNRPQKKNALHPVMVNELAFAMSYARHQPSVWVVVIRARGDVFCAGADLRAFLGVTDKDTPSSIPTPETEVLISDLFNKLHKPCIALVEGNVYAGGMLILAGCTHVLASRKVAFGLPEVKRGLFPFQVMAALKAIIPARQLIDWCIRGYDLNAEQALTWGLLTHITPEGRAEEELQRLLRDILENSPAAIRKGLEAFDHLRQESTTAQYQYLRNMLMQTLQTEDAQEGLAAFREKRSPKWTGY